MFTIENDFLSVSINSKGAELNSIYNKTAQQEYMWSADPAFWAKKSPALFPIVGTIKEDTYFFQGKPYHLPRHGFARESEFTVTEQNEVSVTFTLESNETTLASYPFHFRFDIVYSISAKQLRVTYRVANKGAMEMYFSVGGHPAFNVPLAKGTTYSDYYLEFNEAETTGRWPISKEGLIETATVPLLDNSKVLRLSKELFYLDAIVLKNLKSTTVSLLSEKSPTGLEFDFTGFPYLGIWAFKNADFVCIEPWCGIADSVDTNQQLTEKEGINKLNAGEDFERTWSVRIF